MTRTLKPFNIAVLLLIFLAAFVGYFLFGKAATYSFLLPKNDLKTNIDNVLADSPGRYGIYIKNLNTGESYTKNQHQAFEAGSLYKIWVMGAVFEKIKDGKIKEGDTILADVVKLNKIFEIDPKDAELKNGVINFSVKSAIEQMITISHNYAALALTDKAGSKNIEDFLKKYGLNSSNIGNPPKTTPEDLAKLFEALYKGEVIDKEYSQKMLDILARQTINERIPKYLPADTKIAHKTGDIGYFENDGGIVFSHKGDFSAEGANSFIVVVLSETENPDEAGDKIGRISEAAYKYFNK